MTIELHAMLARVGERVRKMRARWALAACWLLWAGIAAVLWHNAERLQFTGTQLGAAIASGALATATACWLLASRRTHDPNWVARRIESRHPELGAALLAALEQVPAPRPQRLGYLQSVVVREAVSHGRRHDWGRDVSMALLALAQLAQFTAFALLVAACAMLVRRGDALARSTNSAAEDKRTARAFDSEVHIEPGDVDVERGTTVLITAEFARDVPAAATLVVQPARDSAGNDDNDLSASRGMTRTFDDPKFAARLASVREDLLYAVEFSEGRTRQYRITVFDYPALEQADAELTFPDYTSLPPKLIEDVRRVTAVEGSQLTLRCRLNKEVEFARLVDRDGSELALTRTDDEAPVYEVALTLEVSRRFRLQLIDHEGRENKLPPEFVVHVTANRPPKIKLARPGRDVRVSPIEELEVAGEASDDFGLLRYGLSYSIGGDEPQDIVLRDATDADESPLKQAEFSQLVNLEALQAEPDQLVSYYVWVEDVGPDGRPRQTMSDMYFAEVRHFEEIFRQGEQQTEQQREEAQQQQQQQGQGVAQQAAELAELQKQIINATWSLVRRERGGEPSPAFANDADVVTQSQQQALQQLDELAGETTDQQSLAHVADARQQMELAIQRLDEATGAAGVSGLPPAMAAEQAAYQALLKLRAREFSVTEGAPQQQSASSSSASGANSRSQQQLNQLELSADENRYETQSRAQDQQAQAQDGADEAREVLNRLRELARRQEDLNERLRQLQSELQAAESQAQREQIERELKRLREQQQEILRDTEQLQNEMESSENAQQTADAQQQLSETRDRVQQASEALQEGRLSEAVAEGTRAERELNDLRDEFRQRTADRFGEDLRELRSSARELDERQEELTERLTRQQQERNRSLRDEGTREEVAQGLAEQRRAYDELVERIRETVQEAEEPEPLLARELYDAVRDAADAQVAEALDISEQLVDVDMMTEATDTMRAAGRGIGQLRKGVDAAAENILGDQTEALRRAERELQQLQEQLDREIDQARGNGENSQSDAETQDGSGNRQQGTSGADQEDQPGERPGPGQRQPDPSAAPGENDSEAEDRQQPFAGGGSPSNQEQNPPEEQREGEAGEQTPSGDQSQQRQPGQSSGGDGARQADADQSGSNQRPQESDASRQPGSRPPNPESQQRGGRGGDLGSDVGAWFDEWRNGPQRAAGPITGDDYREWSDRLRDVEDLLDDPELRADVARIRDRAEAVRADYKRRSKVPDWDRLIDTLADPLAEVRERIRDEIRRQDSPDALVPIDRDPVPAEYVDRVQRYYERLGSGK